MILVDGIGTRHILKKNKVRKALSNERFLSHTITQLGHEIRSILSLPAKGAAVACSVGRGSCMAASGIGIGKKAM